MVFQQFIKRIHKHVKKKKLPKALDNVVLYRSFFV